MTGVQAMTAGPAAVATLPTVLAEKALAEARKSVAEASQPPLRVATVSAALEFTPRLAKDPGLFQAILNGAFSIEKPQQAAKPEHRELTEADIGDPDEIIPFNGRDVPRWLVHSILKAAIRST
jgi:hypothetical protein